MVHLKKVPLPPAANTKAHVVGPGVEQAGPQSGEKGRCVLREKEMDLSIFDGFAEPVLLLREGRVVYCNRAAEERFPGLGAGEETPVALAELLGDILPPAAAAGTVDGWPCTATVQAAAEGSLVVLRPRTEGADLPGPERLVLQLRRETASLSMAIQGLDPTEGPVDESRAQRYLNVLHQGLYRIVRMADHLDLVGGGDEGQWQPQSLDLAGLCRETAEQVEGLCRMSGCAFTWDLETSGLLTVGDDRLLERMLLCMLSNAMKAAGRTGRFGLKLAVRGSRALETSGLLTVGDDRLLERMLLCMLSNAMKAAGRTGRFGLKLAVRGSRAVVTVWNSGRPLEEKDLSRLFGGAQAPSLDPKAGLGLGLELVRRVASLHGGAVLVESREGVTRCVVSLPIQKPEQGEPLRSPKADYSGGFLPVLVELSDVLPPEVYNFEDLQ